MTKVTTQQKLSPRARLTYGAHLFKALVRQHHRELVPVLEPHLPRDGIVIDVGAHAGQFTKLFARMAPQGRVFAFEPASYARSIVTTVVKLHGLKNVSIIPSGLSDAPGHQTLSIPLKSSGSLGYGLSHLGDDRDDNRPMWQETINLVTLDDFIKAKGIARIDLIKADIEGWEMRFLKGAGQSIARFRPTVLLEINARFLARAGNTPADVWDFFKTHGYRIRQLKNAQLKDAPDPLDLGDILCVA